MADTPSTYELMYIINPVLTEEQTKAIVARVQEYISEEGGDVLHHDEMGSQRLAYPIQKKRNGFYVNLFFRAPAELLTKLDRALRINDDILRHLVLKLDAKMLRHFEQQRRAPRPEAAESE